MVQGSSKRGKQGSLRPPSMLRGQQRGGQQNSNSKQKEGQECKWHLRCCWQAGRQAGSWSGPGRIWKTTQQPQARQRSRCRWRLQCSLCSPPCSSSWISCSRCAAGPYCTGEENGWGKRADGGMWVSSVGRRKRQRGQRRPRCSVAAARRPLCTAGSTCHCRPCTHHKVVEVVVEAVEHPEPADWGWGWGWGVGGVWGGGHGGAGQGQRNGGGWQRESGGRGHDRGAPPASMQLLVSRWHALGSATTKSSNSSREQRGSSAAAQLKRASTHHMTPANAWPVHTCHDAALWMVSPACVTLSWCPWPPSG